MQINSAGWSSLEARRAHNPKVTGSNPVPATLAQLAQLVEQRTENPRVSGSIPELGTICGCSSMVEHQPSKLDTWVRFPSPAYAIVA